MSGGGLLQLLAIGQQDALLTDSSNLRHTFWKQVFKRRTNFAIESIRQTVQGPSPSATGPTKLTCEIARKGDLVTNVVVEVVLKKSGDDSFYAAEHLLKYVELTIGGQRVDHLTNTWLRLYDELYRFADAREAYRVMTDFADDDPTGTVKRFYLHLPFWFCRDLGAALPMISLTYHDVELKLTLEALGNIPGIDPSFEPEVSVWCDYVMLDVAERRRFATSTHTYLIEQTQFASQTIEVGPTLKVSRIPLSFNHPVKVMAWVLRPSEAAHGKFTASGLGLESREACGAVHEVALKLNGTDRFEPRPGSYFRTYHPHTTFGQIPSVGVYVYSFALLPRLVAPSGTLNFSRFDDVQLHLTTKEATLMSTLVPYQEHQTLGASTTLKWVEVYARSYNALTIAGGMAGLAFSA